MTRLEQCGEEEHKDCPGGAGACTHFHDAYGEAFDAINGVNFDLNGHVVAE